MSATFEEPALPAAADRPADRPVAAASRSPLDCMKIVRRLDEWAVHRQAHGRAATLTAVRRSVEFAETCVEFQVTQLMDVSNLAADRLLLELLT